MHDKYTGKSSAEMIKTRPPPLLTLEGKKKIANDTGKSDSFSKGKPG